MTTRRIGGANRPAPTSPPTCLRPTCPVALRSRRGGPVRANPVPARRTATTENLDSPHTLCIPSIRRFPSSLGTSADRRAFGEHHLRSRPSKRHAASEETDPFVATGRQGDHRRSLWRPERRQGLAAHAEGRSGCCTFLPYFRRRPTARPTRGQLIYKCRSDRRHEESSPSTVPSMMENQRDLPGRIIFTVGVAMSSTCVALILILWLGGRQ